jgi:hypothetical protein
VVHAFVVRSTPIRIEADPLAAPIVGLALGHVLPDPIAPCDGDPVVLSVQVGVPSPAEGTDRAPTAFADGWTLTSQDGDVTLFAPSASARLSPRAGRGTIVLAPDALDGPMPWALIIESLLVLLRQRGHYALHAAGLSVGDDGILLVAQRDSGKSTLAYSLVREGWSYLSDDTVLVGRAADRIEATGFRSYFTLDPEADTLFPNLAAGRIEPLFGEAKRPVDVETIHPGQRADRTVPRVLVFPQIVDASESRLEPIGRTEALHHVIGQSALAVAEPDGAPAHVAALTDLVRQCTAYRLLGGRDLLDQPGCATDLLSPLLPTAAAA